MESRIVSNVVMEYEVVVTFEHDPDLHGQLHKYPREQCNEACREYLKIEH